ncbi:MAG: LysR family transcriptional regulator [Gammaproteobacteria bacterium]|nr:LysR family transcriptional regulator [Gammaproteobacteria bacterium]
MDIEILRTFLTVHRLRHFGRAAEELHVTQAAVSARIKLLEQQVGALLFERTKREIRPTTEGVRLLKYADAIIHEWRKLRQDVGSGQAEQITIGGSLRLWNVVIQPWLEKVIHNHPDWSIIAEAHTPELLVQKLYTGAIDVAFMLEPPQLELLAEEDVGHINLRLVHHLPNQFLSTVQRRDYIWVDWGIAHAVQHQRLYPDLVNPLIRVSQAEMAYSLLKSGRGFALLPEPLVEAKVNAGELHWVKDCNTMRKNVYALYPLRSAKRPMIKVALEAMHAIYD